MKDTRLQCFCPLPLSLSSSTKLYILNKDDNVDTSSSDVRNRIYASALIALHSASQIRTSKSARDLHDIKLRVALSIEALELACSTTTSNMQGPWHPQHSQPVRSTNMFQAAADRMAANNHPTQPSKRKANHQISSSTTKKPKTHLTIQPRKYTTPPPQSQLNAYPPQAQVNAHPQPLSTAQVSTILTHPLTNVERWRMKGWTWVEAVFRVGGQQDGGDGDGVESPRGTSFWVENGREG